MNKQKIIIFLSLVLFGISCTKTDLRNIPGSLSLIVTSNVRCQFDPCGWKKNPIGGLPRRLKYIDSEREAGKNPIILDAGEVLFESNSIIKQNLEASKYKAKAMVDGYETIGYDAVNVGGYDLAAGYSFLKSIADSTSISFLSANLVDKESGDHVFDP